MASDLDETLAAVRAEVLRARAKFPGRAHMLAALVEEVGEVESVGVGRELSEGRAMRTTPEQRATMRAALADETYADLNRDEVRDVLALLDDLDEALAASTHRGEALERVAEAVGYPRDAHYADVLGKVDDLVAEVARLRAVADAARSVAAWTMHTDQSTRSATLGLLRAALARLDGGR